MARCLQHRKEYAGEEITIEQADGSRLLVQAHATPYFDEQGKLIGAVNVLVDMTAIRRAEQQLRRNERELTDFFDHATLGLHWVGADGIILRANRAELDLLGYSANEYVGQHISKFHADKDVIEDLLRRLQVGGDLHEYEARLLCKDGSIKHVVINSNVLWEDGRFVHARCFTRDITDRKRAEDERQRLMDELRDADRRKDEFMATLAHELRNPLAPVTMSLELMKRAAGNLEMIEDARSTMERQVTQMVRLVDDLLDVGRIAQNKLELRKESIELASVIHHAVDAIRPLCEREAHELSLRLPAEPIYLDADPARLMQVFGNLLTNACKYTNQRGRIGIGVERQAGHAVISVEDNGIGIPADMLPRIFDMFTQVNAFSERAQRGLGIGLTLVKRLVEMHDGSLTARSEGEGKGSEFVVRLPIREPRLGNGFVAGGRSAGRSKGSNGCQGRTA